MFVATWRHGPPYTIIMSYTWTDALQEALRISAEDSQRDELLALEWKDAP